MMEKFTVFISDPVYIYKPADAVRNLSSICIHLHSKLKTQFLIFYFLFFAPKELNKTKSNQKN